MQSGTSKPGLIGAADRHIEVVCPGESDSKSVMDVLAEMGVLKICMMAKTTRKKGKADEVWTIIPAKGEKLVLKQVTKEGKRWDAHEYMRPKETERNEAGHVSWAMGVKRQSTPSRQHEADTGSISSITSAGVTTETTISRSTLGGAETMSMENREWAGKDIQESIVAERERTRVEFNMLKLELVGALSKDKEERRAEDERRRK